MGEESKVFTLSEVAEHNSNKDCWLVIGGKVSTFSSFFEFFDSVNLPKRRVYDVTKFLEDHPGGDDVLLSATGKDATDDFEDVGHSSTARAMMDEMYVGDIDSATIPTKVKYTPPKQPHYDHDKTSDFVVKIFQFLVPLLILGLAVGIRFYTKSSSE